jgi:hypothetical protein
MASKDSALALAVLSELFALTSLGVVLNQRRAASCPRHRPLAGLVAQALAMVSLVAGVTLAGLALVLAR